MKELEDLDYQLSAEVAKEPSHWNLSPLHERSDALLCAVTRRWIADGSGWCSARFALRGHQTAVGQDRKRQRATDLHNQDAIHASLGGSLGVPMDERFDGVGKLTQIYPPIGRRQLRPGRQRGKSEAIRHRRPGRQPVAPSLAAKSACRVRWDT